MLFTSSLMTHIFKCTVIYLSHSKYTHSAAENERGREVLTHIFLSKVNEVLEVNVIPICFNIVVDEEVQLVFDPVFKHKG